MLVLPFSCRKVRPTMVFLNQDATVLAEKKIIYESNWPSHIIQKNPNTHL